jgi:membrane protein implicated in regulation of membrane protease activity
MGPMFFFYLTAAAMLFLVISMLLGHGHHGGHAVDSGGELDHGHDLGQGGGHDAHATPQSLSIWSSQVLLLFVGGFGIGGYFASISGLAFVITLICAAAGGLALAYVGYAIINLFYRRQYDSNINSYQCVGLTAIVVTSINAGGVGRVRCGVGAGRETFLAKSADGSAIPINSVVRITDMVGSTAVVEVEEPNRQTFVIGRR